MNPKQLLKGWRNVGASLGFVVMALSSLDAGAESSPPAEPSVTKAASYLGLLAGRDLQAEDVAWLKQRWNEDFEATPEVIAAEVDALAFAFERDQRDQDPLALAQSRGQFLTGIYCSPARASDSDARRLKEMLTPDESILAADCLLGLIVTPFDVDGMIASHAMLAAIAGQPHDAESDRADALATVKTSFADATPAEKAVMANGEFRHAVLKRYWSRLEGDPKKKAFIDDVRGMDLGDFRSPARKFEGLALSDLGEIDYLAKTGDAKLTSYSIGEYREWLERIAGQGFDNREQDWLQQAIIDEFRADPNKVIGEVASIDEMNRDYILADTDDQKREMLDGWTADLYCHGNASDDPNERRLIEVVFRHDPIVEADCATGRITRRQRDVVAEAEGVRLLEQDLDAGLRFMRMMLARPLLPEEEVFVREDSIREFQKDPDAWQKEYEQILPVLRKIEGYSSDFFLAMHERKKLFDPIYCSLQTSDEPNADDYLAMFQRNDAIVYEDCENMVVTTEDEVDAFVDISNFLAMLNERPPFDAAETEEIRRNAVSFNLDDTEINMLALQEWWSLLKLEEKIAHAKLAKEEGVAPDGDSSAISLFFNRMKLQVVNTNAMIRNCALQREMNGAAVSLFAARSGGDILSQRGGELGYSGADLGNIVYSSTLLAGRCG